MELNDRNCNCIVIVIDFRVLHKRLCDNKKDDDEGSSLKVIWLENQQPNKYQIIEKLKGLKLYDKTEITFTSK